MVLLHGIVAGMDAWKAMDGESEGHSTWLSYVGNAVLLKQSAV
jgi:hypothetical protein